MTPAQLFPVLDLPRSARLVDDGALRGRCGARQGPMVAVRWAPMHADAYGLDICGACLAALGDDERGTFG